MRRLLTIWAMAAALGLAAADARAATPPDAATAVDAAPAPSAVSSAATAPAAEAPGDYVVPPGLEPRVRALLAPAIGAGAVGAIAIDRGAIRIETTPSGAQVTLTHPSRATADTLALPSFAVALSARPSDAPDLETVLSALRANDTGNFPWQRLEPTPEPALPPHPPDSPSTQTGQPEIRGFLPDDVPWRRAAREAGPLGWGALVAGAVALFALVLAVGRRRRSADRARQTAPARPAVRLVAAGLALAAIGGSAYLLDAIARRALPAPRWVRGPGPDPATPPPEGSAALYAWGDSTMTGDCYWPQLDIPRLAAWALGDKLGDAPLHVTNLAVSGSSLSGGLPERLMTVLSEPERFRPRVVLVHIGHNEHAGPKPVVPTEGFEAERRELEAGYDAKIRVIARACRDAGALLVVVLPMSNKAGSPPQWSVHGDGVGAGERAEVERLLGEAQTRLVAGDAVQALAMADQAAGLSPEFARSHWFRGQALDALGRKAEAYAAYDRAVMLDRDRSRATPSQNDLLRRLCAEGLARCVDPEASLRAEGVRLDDRYFVDHHHPRAAGHVRIAQLMADAVAEALGLPTPRRLDATRLPEPFDLAGTDWQIATSTASWYLAQATRIEAFDSFAFQDALTRAERAIEGVEARLPEDPGAREGELRRVAFQRAMLAAFRGDAEGARRLLARARQGPPNFWVEQARADTDNRAVLERVVPAAEIGD
ncbi:MAG: GDSL-type esterase/lipase family protein [Myxococcota bacterium]